MRDLMLALLANDAVAGLELRQRWRATLGPLAGELDVGQVYETLGRLERAGLVTTTDDGRELADRPDKRIFSLTADGHLEVARWLEDLSWPSSAPTAFHLKLLVASRSGLAPPLALIGAQREEVARELREVRELADEVAGDEASALLLEGAILRLEADLVWLGRCERRWLEGGVS